MTLHSLVQSLLPTAYREQVLGDLQERGFRLTDIASVLPRIWWTHAARQWTGPVPQMAAASDSAILARTQQLARQGARAAGVVFFAIGILGPVGNRPPLVGWQVFPMIVACGLASLGLYFIRFRRAIPESGSFDNSRAKLLSKYQQQIDYQVTMAKSFLALPALILVPCAIHWYRSGHLSGPLMLAYSAAFGVALLAQRRISRLRRELETLQVAK
jgi:hypothetical protein